MAAAWFREDTDPFSLEPRAPQRREEGLRVPGILSQALPLVCLVLFLSGGLKKRLSYFPREQSL